MLFGQKRAEIYLNFEHPTFQGAPFRALFVYHVRMLIAIRADLQSLSAPL